MDLQVQVLSYYYWVLPMVTDKEKVDFIARKIATLRIMEEEKSVSDLFAGYGYFTATL